MRIAIATAILTGIYALALASADPWDLALGAALGLCVALTFAASSWPAPHCLRGTWRVGWWGSRRC